VLPTAAEEELDLRAGWEDRVKEGGNVSCSRFGVRLEGRISQQRW